jgi:tagatose 6-phosphate kinase
MILCIGTTPAAQRVMVFPTLQIDAVNRARVTLETAAGKSINVAKVLARLGAKPVATGFLGGNRGGEILRFLTERGIESDFVEVSAPTRQCTSVLNESTREVTELVEESLGVRAEDYDKLLVVIDKYLCPCSAVVQSGSLTPGGPVDFYKTITERATSLGVLSIVDAQGKPLIEALKARPGLVKPNRAELAATVGRALKSEADVVGAMREIRERGAMRVVVTAGTEPSLAVDETGVWRVSSPRVAAVNPIGSGDAFTAALAWRLTLNDMLGEACRWAAAAGAANALNTLPGELEKSELESLYDQTHVEEA